MSGFNAYDQALASVLSQAVAGGPMPSMEYDKKFSLFCQNLPYSATLDEIYDTFPKSVNVTLVLGDDNRPRGTCVVYFASAQQCDDAYNLSKTTPITIKGRAIRVNYNNGDNKTSTFNSAPSTGAFNAPPPQAAGGFNSAPNAGGYGQRQAQSYQQYQSQPQRTSQPPPPPAQQRAPQSNDYSARSRGGASGGSYGNDVKICMTVFNLPYAARESEIQSKFHSATRVYIKKGPDGRSKGIAVIHFNLESERDTAMNDVFSIEMNGRQLRAEVGDQTSGGGGGGGYQQRNNDYGSGGGYQQRNNDYGSGGGYGRGGDSGAPQRSRGGGFNRGPPGEQYNRRDQGGRRNDNPRGDRGGYEPRGGGGRYENQQRGGHGGGSGGFRGGRGGGGGGDKYNNARDRSPVDEGKKSKYGMGSITSAIVRQLPSSGRPMSSSSESDSE